MLFLILLGGTILTMGVMAVVQYHDLTVHMVSTKATVVDMDWEHHVRGPHEQKLTVTYEVDGVTYERELSTDTKVSFSAGRGANYSVGDSVTVLYDPQNPETIASPRSMTVTYFYTAVSLPLVALGGFFLVWMLMHTDRYMQTPKEYEKEGEQKREARREKRIQKRRKHAGFRRVMRLLLLVLAGLVGGFVLFLAFGMLLKAFGY